MVKVHEEGVIVHCPTFNDLYVSFKYKSGTRRRMWEKRSEWHRKGLVKAEGTLRPQKHLLLFQRTEVLFPAPHPLSGGSQPLVTTALRELMPSLTSTGTVLMCTVLLPQHRHVHMAKKKNKTYKNGYIKDRESVSPGLLIPVSPAQ